MRYEEESLKKIVSESKSYTDVVRKLGLKPFYGNRQTAKKYIILYNIDISHFGGCEKFEFHKRRELSEILVVNSTYRNTTNLKERLYKEGLKKRECELCGQTEIWNGEKMSLILDHINGINNDNRIENLRIVCPNCNATLDTHCGKNVKQKPYKQKISKKYFCECGNKKANKSAKMCKNCYDKKQRKRERPPYEQLIQEVKINGFLGTGKKYGVSDNAIRKWIKYYEKKVVAL
jgi:hypothetical protein